MRPLRPTDLVPAVPLDLRGLRTPATLLKIDERNHLLREAVRFFPGQSRGEAALQLRTALTR
jgi:hypothetical protein